MLRLAGFRAGSVPRSRFGFRCVLFAAIWAAAAWVAATHGAERWPFYEPLDPPRAIAIVVDTASLAHVPPGTDRALDSVAEDLLPWASFPVRRAADGTLVACDDALLSALANVGDGVARHSGAEIESVDAGSRFASRVAGAKLMSLATLLGEARGRVNLLLDLAEPDFDAALEKLMAAVEDVGLARQVAVRVPSAKASAALAKARNRVAIAQPVDLDEGIELDAAVRLPEIILLSAEQADTYAAVVSQLQARGARIWADLRGTKPSGPLWQAVYEARVDGVWTDDAPRWLAFDVRQRVASPAVRWAMHRGASRYAPENTMAAFELAADLGADYVELDIQTTRDDRHVLMHDRTAARTAGVDRAIREMPLAEVALLDVGRWFAPRFEATRVPELEAALAQLLARSGLGFYLDAKNIDPVQLGELLKTKSLAARSLVFQAPAFGARVRTTCAEARLMPPLYNAAQITAYAKDLRPYAVDASWQILSAELIAQCHAAGIQVFSDALGDHETVEAFRQAIAWKIDCIQTDQPLRLLRALELEAAAAEAAAE